MCPVLLLPEVCFMKKKLISILLLAAMLTGCSSQTTVQTEREPETLDAALSTEPAPVQISGLVYYITDHGTADPSDVSSFASQLQETGYTWETGSITDIPAAPDTVAVLNTPTEDITQADLDTLDSMLDAGGHILLLLPSSEEPVRFKYLERLLEEYCIQLDYDLVTETDPSRIYNDDDTFVYMEQIGTPDGMSVAQAVFDQPLYLRNARSFHFYYRDNYSAIKQDAMLESGTSAVGTPCGGTEDDPETFEEEQLITMLYSRNDQRLNSSIVTVGSADFLLDTYYHEPTSETIQAWVFAAVQWMACYYTT